MLVDGADGTFFELALHSFIVQFIHSSAAVNEHVSAFSVVLQNERGNFEKIHVC